MKLQSFLYLLIRDEITIGKVESLMRMLPPDSDENGVFSQVELAEYAKKLKERLLEEGG